TWSHPGADLNPNAIAPDLALLSLAGLPDRVVLDLALESQELETAYALLSLSPRLEDAERVSGWLLLGDLYRKAGWRARALLSYRMAAGGALRSPTLGDRARAVGLLTAAHRLAQMGAREDARFYLDQAVWVLARAPTLTVAERQRLFPTVTATYQALGLHWKAWQSLTQRLRPGASRAIPSSPPPTRKALVLPRPVRDARLLAATAVRQQAARELLAVWGCADNGRTRAASCRAEAQARLAEALRAEDEAIRTYLAAAGETTEAAATELYWLALKRQVAQGGFGLDLVPEWREALPELRTALSAAYGRLVARRQQERPADEVARQALTWCHWGLYPHCPQETLARALPRQPHHPLDLVVLQEGDPPRLGYRGE
ncbi:MAG: hypothetical protein D6759_17985, partial [Chloroflexi bacterium]